MPGCRGGQRPSVATTVLLLLAVLLWLAFPSLAWAHDCPTRLELKICLTENLAANLAMVGAALAAIGYLASPQGPLGGAAPPTLQELRDLASKPFEGEPPRPEYADPKDKPSDGRDSAPHGGLGPNRNIRR